jgi:hypothetical protein
LFDRIICDAARNLVVCDHGGGGLRVAEFFERGSLGNGFLAIVEQTGEFGFAGAGDDFAEDFRGYIDGAVEWRRRVIGFGWAVWMGATAEVMEARKAGAGFGFTEVGSIAFDPENHIAGDIFYAAVRVGRNVVE